MRKFRILVPLMLLSVLMIFPIAAQAAECDGFTYELHDGKATITGCNLEYNYYMDIPATVDGYPVVSIGEQAFQDCKNLLEVTIPEGVETIEAYAFYQCYNLRWLTLPDSLVTIEDKAFCNCRLLENLNFGRNLKKIGDSAFLYCDSLDFYLEFPEGLEIIGGGAFYDCDSLQTVLLPDSLKELGTKAFAMCGRLDYIYIPDDIPQIGYKVLNGSACYNYQNYWYNDGFYIGPYLLEVKRTASGSFSVCQGTTNVADGAFEYCTNLTEVILPNSLRVIGANAFENCDGLQDIVIPEGVTTIGNEAFYWCENLKNVQIPTSVKYIGQDAFARTPFYKNAEHWENGALYAGSCLVTTNGSASGVLEVKPGTTTIMDGALKGATKLTGVIMPDSVTYIGEKAFYECTGLKTVQLGKGVSQIEDSAFGKCPELESIVVDKENKTYRTENNCLIQGDTLVLGCKNSQIPISNSVTQIGAFAFEGCAGLTEITIPDTISIIGEGAFRDCNALKTVILGNGVQIVGKRAFEECGVLSQINLGESVHTIDDFAFAYNHQITKVDFPASLRHLGEEAFSNGTGIKSVSFQDGLLSIGKNCFIFCENLTSVSLPDSLEEIKHGAFYSCEKIETLTLGEGLITIGETAFDGCKALKTLTIPKSVETIGKNAFYECTSLTQVDLGNVKKIGNSAFESCSSLKQIHIPASVTEIGKQVFSYCSAMEQMTVSPDNRYYHSQDNCIIHTGSKILVSGCKTSIIPNDGSVTVLQAYSFAGHSGLTRIEVPDHVTRIDPYTFYNCYGLEYMKLPFVGGSEDGDNYIGYIFGGGPSQNDLFVPGRLKEVVITGGSVVSDSGFKKCSGIQRIELPESITTIGYYAFANCPKLEYVIVPGNLQIIKHSGVFDGTPYAMMRISKDQENTVSLVKESGIRHQIGGLITFVDEENQVISRQWYAVNREITAPDVPEKPDSEKYTYEAVWEPIPDRCNGNQTISLRYVAHRIGGVVPGDLTGDDKINSLDGLLLMRYLNGWEISIADLNAMDVNGDGKVNSLDGLILMRYLNGWNITLG